MKIAMGVKILSLPILMLIYVAVTSAGKEPECGPLEIFKIKKQWRDLYRRSDDQVGFGIQLWKRVFKDHPDLATKYLSNVNASDISSPVFRAFVTRVSFKLDNCIFFLSDQPTLDVELRFLRRQHKKYGVPAEYYETFRKHLMAVAEQWIGSCNFNKEAWDACTPIIMNALA